MFILSLTTKHRNLNLILLRSVLLTERSNFFFLGGGGLSFILRYFFSKEIIVADKEQGCLNYQTSLNLSSNIIRSNCILR